MVLSSASCHTDNGDVQRRGPKDGARQVDFAEVPEAAEEDRRRLPASSVTEAVITKFYLLQ